MTASECRILIADDEQSFRGNLNQFLRLFRPRWEVDEAGNEIEGLELVESRLASGDPVDLVITDLVMQSELGGLLLVREALARDPSIQVILYSRDPSKLDRSAALSMGVSEIVDIGRLGMRAFDEILSHADAALKCREIDRKDLTALRSLAIDGRRS